MFSPPAVLEFVPPTPFADDAEETLARDASRDLSEPTATYHAASLVADNIPHFAVAPADGSPPLVALRDANTNAPEAGAGAPTSAKTTGGAAAAGRERGRGDLRRAGDDGPDEWAYRFPLGRAAVEIVPDLPGTFCVRLAWNRGKALIPLIETTALRPIAQVTVNGQRFPVFPSQHGRKKRDRIVIAGKRKVAKSARCSVRYIAFVEGREDRLLWTWRIGATQGVTLLATENRGDDATSKPADEVTLYLPFSPGRARVLTLPGADENGPSDGGGALCLWMNDVAVTIAPGRCEGGAEAFPVITQNAKGVQVTLQNARFAGTGVTVRLETWLHAARTESEARFALLRHIADAADRAQQNSAPADGAPLFADDEPEAAAPAKNTSEAQNGDEPVEEGEVTETAEVAPSPLVREIALPVAKVSAPTLTPGFLNALAARHEAVLMRDDYVEKRGADRVVYRVQPGETGRAVCGDGADAALAAGALLGRFYLSGDDAVRRRARLAARGVCDFQINTEDSPHWGAIWDAQKRDKKTFEDFQGGTTISVAAAARAAKGLHVLHDHFGTEILSRTALGAAQWLMLKMDRSGLIPSERFEASGPPVLNGSPWVTAEALIPLAETFRRTKTEVFLKTAQRVIATLGEQAGQERLPFERASCEHIAAAIEGILLVSREYENADLINLARKIALALRARRKPGGGFSNPPTAAQTSPLAPTLAGARAALALMRVDNDPLWPLLALRALRAASAVEANRENAPLTLADHGGLCALPTHLLLCLAQRAANCVADRDHLTVTRAWQTFKPDPATREYIRVTEEDDETPADYLALVCPVTLQVLIMVIAPSQTARVRIHKNNRRPFVKNLLNGEFDQQANLVPLGDGGEAAIGVFLADT